MDRRPAFELKTRDIRVRIDRGIRATLRLSPHVLEPGWQAAQDDARWAAAQVDACRAAASLAACDSVRAYLRDLPNGRHAVEAHEALAIAQPVIARLQQAADAVAARTGAVIRAQEAAAGFTVARMRVTLDETAQTKIARIAGDSPPTNAGLILQVHFDLTVTRKQGHAQAQVRAACGIDGQRRVSTAPATLDLATLNVGDTIDASARPYGVATVLQRAPSQCDITVNKFMTFGVGGEQPVHSFCFAPGVGLAEGGCTWPRPGAAP